MNEENVLKMFLRIVTDYDYLSYEDVSDEKFIEEEFNDILSMAVAEVQMQGVLEENSYDPDLGGFMDELTVKEVYILAYASVLIWLTPKVNSAEMLAAQLTSTDFTQFSNANRLNACMKLYHQCEAKLNNLILDYDKSKQMSELREEL